MKKFTKVSAAILSGAMLAGMAGNVVMAEGVAYDGQYSLGDMDAALDGQGSITVYKLLENTTARRDGTWLPDAAVTQEKISGVIFKYFKAADIVTGTNFGPAFDARSFDAGLASLLGISLTEQQPDPQDPSQMITRNKQYITIAEVNAAIAAKNAADPAALTAYINDHGTAMAATNAAGMATTGDIANGLYIVAETDVSGARNAAGNAIEIDDPSVAFAAMVPTTNVAEVKIGSDNYPAGQVWQYDLVAYPKNAISEPPVKKVLDDSDNFADSHDVDTNKEFQEVVSSGVTVVNGENKNTQFDLVVTYDEAEQIKFTEGDIDGVYYRNSYAELTKKADVTAMTKLTKGTDYDIVRDDAAHKFTIKFLEAGLAKLDALDQKGQVAALFTVKGLDPMAGTPAASGEMDIANDVGRDRKRTFDAQSKHTPGNEVKVYTYGIELTKTGLTDPTKSVFNLLDASGNKLKFDLEGGKYILNADSQREGAERIQIGANGIADILGLDAGTYQLEEIETEAGKNLLKDKVAIQLVAKDPVDGKLAKAVVNGADMETAGAVLGLTVQNNQVINTLHTGGEGTRMYYIAAGGLMMLVAVAAVARKRRESLD